MLNVSTLLLDDALKPSTPLITPLVSGVAGFSPDSDSEIILKIIVPNFSATMYVIFVTGLFANPHIFNLKIVAFIHLIIR